MVLTRTFKLFTVVVLKRTNCRHGSCSIVGGCFVDGGLKCFGSVNVNISGLEGPAC